MNNTEEKINFLTNAISETQELIRFTETKTALAITLLSAYIVVIFTKLDNIIMYHYKFDLLFWICLYAFLLSLILSIIIITRIILNTTSPVKNIKGINNNNQKLKYFLTPNESKDVFYPFMNRSKYKLKISFDSYLQSIKDSSSDQIIETLTLELLKVSYIRNLKGDRFRRLLLLLLIVSISFTALYFVYTWETQQYLPNQQNCCKP